MKKITNEQFRERIKKWGWLCNIIPHKWVSADNDVVTGCVLCLRCGAIAAADKVGFKKK